MNDNFAYINNNLRFFMLEKKVFLNITLITYLINHRFS